MNEINEKNTVQYYDISSEEEGQRLDNYLLRILKGVPRSLIYKIIRGGEVRVNKKRCKPLLRVQAGDKVRVPPVRMNVITEDQPLFNPLAVAWLEDHILYEEEAFLILNKPAGLAVHGGSGIRLGAIEMLQKLRPQCKTLELGHRLDKETSGCLFIAKKRSYLRMFHQLLRDKHVEKTYMAFLNGSWAGKKKQTVSEPLLKKIMASGERMVCVNEEGKESTTVFELIKNFKHACCVKAKPVTGRTHQIRVHAAHLGHPVLGDEKYGQYDVNRAMQADKNKSNYRLCLHASSLKFTLPKTVMDVRAEKNVVNDHIGHGGECFFEAPLDDKMQTLLENFEHE